MVNEKWCYLHNAEQERQSLDKLISIRKDCNRTMERIGALQTRMDQLEEELSNLNAAFAIREVLSCFEEATVQYLQNSFQFRSKAKQLGNILHLLAPVHRSNVEELIYVLERRLPANIFAHPRPQESPTDILNRWYNQAQHSLPDEATKNWFKELFTNVLQDAITLLQQKAS
jgi:hypothetical protein